MTLLKRFVQFFPIIGILVLLGCSSGNPVTPSQNTPNPVSVATSVNILGAYELTINVDSMTAELTPHRGSAIGESWIVSGISYFTVKPCVDCFKLSSLGYEDGRIIADFAIRHPFEKGNPEEPPSGRNRLDLDVFDLAAVIVPKPFASVDYALLGVAIPEYQIENPDGYTAELAGVTGSPIALPYVLVIDDSADSPPSNTFNKFEMGASTNFEVVFPLQPPDAPSQAITFDIYLTFGYGSSAVLIDRFDPKYYNPEFNRKAAWKVEVEPPGTTLGNTWDHLDDSSEYDVTVKVYDWQIGANVNSDLEELSDIYASSNVDRVSLEIPGMTNAVVTVDGDTHTPGGTGMPDSPLVYKIPVANENLLPIGKYNGLVAVYDERSPLAIAEGRDHLYHTPDGGENLHQHEIPAYATYQTFTATVVENTLGTGNLMWAKRATGDAWIGCRAITTLSDDSIVVGGFFNRGSVTFGEGTSRETTFESIFLSTRAYIARYDRNGGLWWANKIKTFGHVMELHSASVRSITILPDDSIVAVGSFSGLVEFGTGAPNETSFLSSSFPQHDMFIARYSSDGTFMWATAAHAAGSAEFVATSVESFGNSIIVTGFFEGTAIFGKDEPNETELTSAGGADLFLACYNLDGTLAWARHAASGAGDIMPTGSTRIYVRIWPVTYVSEIIITGYFQGSAIFGEGTNQTTLNSAGDNDIFIARYNSGGYIEWAKRAGGTQDDRSSAVTSTATGVFPETNAIYVTGSFQNQSVFGPGEENQTSLVAAGDTDCFIARYNVGGTLEWVKRAGATGTTQGRAITAIGQRIFISGDFTDNAFFGLGEPNETRLGSYEAGSNDTFIARYAANGTLRWAKQSRGPGNDYSRGLTRLSDDSTVMIGDYQETITLGPGEPAEIEFTSPRHTDVFIARFEP